MAQIPEFGYGDPRLLETSEQVLELTNVLKGYNDARPTLNGGLNVMGGDANEVGLQVGEASTGLYSPDGTALGLSVDGTERARIGSAGLRVEPGGVGGDASHPLHVVASGGPGIRIEGGTDPDANSGTGRTTPANVAGFLRVMVNNTERRVPYYTT